MGILNAIWTFFATYILQKPPYMVGFLTLLGYCLMGKKWYDTLAGTLKAIIGMLILSAGSGGLVTNFRPILAGLKDRFNLTAAVIDPYYHTMPYALYNRSRTGAAGGNGLLADSLRASRTS